MNSRNVSIVYCHFCYKTWSSGKKQIWGNFAVFVFNMNMLVIMTSTGVQILGWFLLDVREQTTAVDWTWADEYYEVMSSFNNQKNRCPCASAYNLIFTELLIVIAASEWILRPLGLYLRQIYMMNHSYFILHIQMWTAFIKTIFLHLLISPSIFRIIPI